MHLSRCGLRTAFLYSVKEDLNCLAGIPERKRSQAVHETVDRDQCVLDHLGLARIVAFRVGQTLPVHFELDDLVHAGILGLLDAAQKYDASRRVNFRSYAKYRIRGAILDSLRQLDTASRDLRRRWKLIESARRELLGLLKRDPTEDEIAEHLQMDIGSLRKTLFEIRSVGEISNRAPSSWHEGSNEHEFESAPELQPDAMCSMAEMREALAEAMSLLRPRQRQVLRLYYGEQQTMKQIGLALGVNESRVSQLHRSALSKMRVELEARGVYSEKAF